MDKKSKFFLASICVFNSGAIMLAFYGLDWLSWSIMASSVVIWMRGLKYDR